MTKTTRAQRSAAARLLGAAGASKGGFARRDALTPQRRTEIAQTASRAALEARRQWALGGLPQRSKRRT